MGTICDFKSISTQEEVKINRIDNDASTNHHECKSETNKDIRVKNKEDILLTLNDHHSILKDVKEDKEMKLEEVASNSSIQFDNITSAPVNTYMKKKSIINRTSIMHGLLRKEQEH